MIKLPPCAPPASQLAEAISDGASAPAPDADTGDEADGSDEADNRRLAHQFFLEKRSPDGKEIPYSLYAAAKEHARHMPTHSAHDRQLGPSQDSSDAGNGAGSPDSAAAPNAPLAPAASLTGWTQIGPGNIGGRVGALVIDPTAPLIMYAGSDGGGVYKTIDAGANWAPIGDAFTGLGVNALAMSPTNHNVLYAGTGWSPTQVYGAGIFATADAGAHWTWLASTQTSDFIQVNDIVIDATGAIIYAATNSGVFGSVNGGTSWVKIFNAGNSGGCIDLAIRSDIAQDSLIVTCGGIYLTGASHPSDGSVWRNPDAAGTGTWTEVLNEGGMGRVSLAIAPSQQATIYAMASSTTPDAVDDVLHAFYRSTDGGATWAARVRNTDATLENRALLSAATQFACDGTASGQGWYDNVVAVDPLDPNRVWAAGIDSFRSDDGGANWGIASVWWGKQLADRDQLPVPPQYAHGDFHALTFTPGYNGTTNQTMYAGNDGGVFRTASARGATQFINNNDCSPNNNVSGLTGSVAWTELNHNFNVTEFYDGVPYPDGATYFGGSQDNGTVRGSDATGTNAWSVLRGGDGGDVAVDPTNTDVLYQENQRFGFRKSSDGGVTFAPADNGVTGDTGFLFITPFRMDPTNSETLWTGGTYLWRTTDGAANWERASASTGGTVQAIAISPTNGNHVLVATSGGNILRSTSALSTNQSTAWAVAHPGPAGGAFGLAFDPADDNVAYALFSRFGVGHVWKTTDGGVTWFNIDGAGVTGLPDIPVHALVVDPLDHSRLYIATDIGVLATLDGGANWAVENNGFASVITESLKLNTIGGQNQLYAFTYGRSAWRAAMPAACVNDTDCDGVSDLPDNCVTSSNASQANTDAANTAANRPGADVAGDACDDDKDGDGYADSTEVALGKNPLVYCQIMRADVDGDGAVSILDLTKVAQKFTQLIPPAPERYKQDADNAISILDLTRMAQVFIKHTSDCP